MVKRAAKQYITNKHKDYPQLLREIYQPPSRLYLSGALPTGPMVAIVGTRKPTNYGRQVAYQMAFELAQAGFVIVSGLAYGIDGVVHRAAVEAGGQTIAVLGCGLDICYPMRHQSLANDIINGHGAVITEHPPGTPALAHHFPARNRIIAGLSLGVIVPEADERSGSLITARIALDEGRVVMAVPGSIFSQRSAGPHNLLKAGAVPVTTVSDVCLGLGIEPPPITSVENLPTGLVGSILTQLSIMPDTVETLVNATNESVGRVTSTLTTLELTGHVRHLGGGQWMRLK